MNILDLQTKALSEKASTGWEAHGQLSSLREQVAALRAERAEMVEYIKGVEENCPNCSARDLLTKLGGGE